MLTPVTVADLDKDIKFLTEESTRLLKMKDQPWAQSKADRYVTIIEHLTTIRRTMQMTTIGGKRLEG